MYLYNRFIILLKTPSSNSLNSQETVLEIKWCNLNDGTKFPYCELTVLAFFCMTKSDELRRDEMRKAFT